MPARILICEHGDCLQGIEMFSAFEPPKTCPNCGKPQNWRTIRAEWPFRLNAHDRKLLKALRIESD